MFVLDMYENIDQDEQQHFVLIVDDIMVVQLMIDDLY